MKQYLVMAGVALAVTVVWGAFFGPVQKVVNQAAPSLGAVSSPDINSPYFSFGQVRLWAAHTDSLTAATTTVCALQSPAATSTLLKGSVSFSVSSSTATIVTMAKATTPYATTTSLGSAILAAGAQGTFNATTTPVVGVDDKVVFAPNSYFVVGMAGGVGTFSPTGTCQAVWVQNSY